MAENSIKIAKQIAPTVPKWDTFEYLAAILIQNGPIDCSNLYKMKCIKLTLLVENYS